MNQNFNMNQAQNQNFNQNFYVIGKIGNTEIIKQSVEEFTDSLIQIAWTNIHAYRPAQPCDVKLLFDTNSSKSVPNIKSLNMDDIFVNDNLRIDDFRQYQREIENKQSKTIDLIAKEKNYLISNVIKDKSLDVTSSTSEITKKIKDNLKNIYLSNENLSNKLSKFSTYFSNLPGNNYNK